MRILLASTLLVLTSLSVTGCAEHTDSVDEGVQSHAEALSSLGESLVGDLHYGSGHNFYETLSLHENGKYSASWKPCPPTAKCASRLETGKWKTRSSNKLVLRPTGKAEKTYSLSVAGDGSGFKISSGGKTERLDFDVPPVVTCSSDADCAANEECRFVSNCPPAPPGGVTCLSGQDVCVAVAMAGESCGFRTQSIECATGLDCRWNGGPRDSLTCAPHIPQAGEFCGGIAAIQCDAGLTCVAEGSYPDAGGTCTDCPIPPCAPPPEGCYYEPSAPVPGACPTGCGTLVCDGGLN